MVDFAYRAHSHNWSLDPVVRSLLDTDIYKFLMHQLIVLEYPTVQVGFGLINRTRTISLPAIIPIEVLRAHLDHARTLRTTNNELIWIRGNMFYGRDGMFKNEYIEFLRNYRLPEYEIEIVDGQYKLTFRGNWAEVTMWEIHAITIVNELRVRASLKNLSKFELDVLYSRAKTRLWEKLLALKAAGVTGVADFGTRRRHSFLWQEWAVQAAAEVLGKGFLGTSNTSIAMKHGLEAIGTNAHELPMVLAALADTDEELRESQYEVLRKWQNMYQDRLLVALPDAFGTTQFLKGAPEFLDHWRGFRVDSKDPVVAGYEFIDWWKSRGQNPREKLNIWSDGLDAPDIIKLHGLFRDLTIPGYGWGTNLTNDFRGCHPRGEAGLEPISLVCKVTDANGRPAVKLSDNISKATGPKESVERYKRVFGIEGAGNAPVIV